MSEGTSREGEYAVGTTPQAGAFIPYHVPVPSRRPTSVLVLGILGIVLAAISILGLILSLVMVIVLGRMQGIVMNLWSTPEERAWYVVQMIASWGLYSVLLWASIAAIRLRPWARAGMLRWAWTYLIWLGVETIIIATWVLPASAASVPGAGPPLPGEEVMGYLWLAMSVVLSVIYPGFVIVYLRKPHVRAAFEQTTGAPLPVAGFAPAEYESSPTPSPTMSAPSAQTARATSIATDPSEPLPLPPLPERAEP